ncbi:unnamed protein product, partial [Chrysoparadoxa australica]
RRGDKGWEGKEAMWNAIGALLLCLLASVLQWRIAEAQADPPQCESLWSISSLNTGSGGAPTGSLGINTPDEHLELDEDRELLIDCVDGETKTFDGCGDIYILGERSLHIDCTARCNVVFAGTRFELGNMAALFVNTFGNKCADITFRDNTSHLSYGGAMRLLGGTFLAAGNVYFTNNHNPPHMGGAVHAHSRSNFLVEGECHFIDNS